jgi:hypothetical protein
MDMTTAKDKLDEFFGRMMIDCSPIPGQLHHKDESATKLTEATK